VEAIAIDEDAYYDLDYDLQGNGITLGSGGLIAGSATLPSIMLASPQTWSDDGGGTFRELHVAGNVSGAQTLHLDVSHSARVAVEGEVEVGALSIVGANGADTGAHAAENGYLEVADLNGTDGSPVNLTNAALNPLSAALVSSYTVGPLTSTGGALGVASLQPGTVTVNGSVTLDGASDVRVGINKSGTIAGTDYSQLKASGPVTLGGELEVEGLNQSGNVCPTLQPGDVDTLLTTSGTLSGQFDGVSDGQLVPVTSSPVEGFEGVRPRCATVRVNYATHSVTATIVSVTPPPRDVSPPSIAGNTWVGETLTVHGGTFISEAEPGGDSGQYPIWEDCDATGNGCTRIETASEPTYTLTAADIGHTIKVQEDFYDVMGNAFATSALTSVVTSSKPEPQPELKSEPKPSPVLGSTMAAGPLAKTALAAPILAERENVTVISGQVTVRPRGGKSFVPLSGSTSIPDGSEVEATNGRVVITVATPTGKTMTAEVYGGRFRVHQMSNGETLFILTLPLTGCPRVALPHGAAATVAKHSSGPTSRHLWVSETGGSWGTNGRYVSTTVEGTTWLTVDECMRSQVKVTTGKVKVLDLVRKKTKTVPAGQSYVAWLNVGVTPS
jgi:hypothetical protein